MRFDSPKRNANGGFSIKAEQPMPVVFLDITKAFDSVPHDYVRLKVWKALKRSYDSEQAKMMLSFITAFLHQREFRILAQGIEPGGWESISAGVPQGAVLSPLLYALFIDDLIPDLSRGRNADRQAKVLAFADDLAIIPPINQEASRRQAICSRSA